MEQFDDEVAQRWWKMGWSKFGSRDLKAVDTKVGLVLASFDAILGLIEQRTSFLYLSVLIMLLLYHEPT